MLTNTVLGGGYLHCLGRKFSLDNRELIILSNLLAPAPGLRSVVLPITEHGSVPFSLLPMHQPPGTSMPEPRDRINFVKHWIILAKFSRKWSITVDHFLHVIKIEMMGMLLGRVIPRYEVEVTVHSCVPKLLGITDDSVEVSFWGRYKV